MGGAGSSDKIYVSEQSCEEFFRTHIKNTNQEKLPHREKQFYEKLCHVPCTVNYNTGKSCFFISYPNRVLSGQEISNKYLLSFNIASN